MHVSMDIFNELREMILAWEQRANETMENVRAMDAMKHSVDELVGLLEK